jgi:catechol 2,3-dioxygenase-like lactoylglutathione lyase family enzyme
MMQASITVFTVKDVTASLAYFRDKLGFDVAFEYGPPPTMSACARAR